MIGEPKFQKLLLKNMRLRQQQHRNEDLCIHIQGVSYLPLPISPRDQPFGSRQCKSENLPRMVVEELPEVCHQSEAMTH